MLGFTVLIAPATAPVIIAQAPAQNAAPQSDITKTITFCQDVESLIPDSASNDFSPLGFGFKSKPGVPHDSVEQVKGYRVTLVTPPQHGEVRLLDERSQQWTFLPRKGYTGADRAIYLVEYEGKRYTVVANFWVVKVLEEDVKIPECKSIKFAPVNGAELPAVVPPTSTNDFQSWASDAVLASLLNSTYFNFSNLPTGEVGNTTGTGPTAKITLDTNAAGHGWYIDSTPLSNEEFLPTANANIWKAKAGSAAEGKMDMLSVLLHEYGHSLGLATKPDTHVNADLLITPKLS